MSNKKKRVRSSVAPAQKSDKAIKRIPAAEMLNSIISEQEAKQPIYNVNDLLKPYSAPSGVIPRGGLKHVSGLASDSAYTTNQLFVEGLTGYNGVIFKGYMHYAQLYNMPEFRKIVEVMSTEITRKWIDLRSTTDDKVTDKIKAINEELSRLSVQTRISELVSHNFIYGRGQLYIELKMPKGTGLVSDDNEELKSALSIDSNKIPENGIVSLNIIDPIQTTAAQMNTNEPLKSDYYEPRTWYVAGKEVHSDRIITLITNEVSIFLKPSFNYGGLSLLQLVEPTVNNWLTVRDSGKDLVKGSNIFALKCNMQNIVGGDNDSDIQSAEAITNLIARAKLFSMQRNSQALMLLDKELEDLININVSMAGIAEMITKYQEQPSQVTGIPVVKLTGNTPSGLNASSEGEIQVFYDMITALKEAYIREPLQKIINIIQVSLFGEVDDSITFDFVPMKELTEKEKAEVEAIKVSSVSELVGSGTILDTEGRAILKRSGNPDFSDLEEEINNGEEEQEDPENKLD